MATASDPNVLALQTAVSRFSSVVPSIGSVTADGIMSATVLANVQAALGYVAANDSATDAAGVSQQTNAANLLAQIIDQSALQQSASGVATFLNQTADDLSLGGSNLNIVPAGIPGAAQANQLINAALNLPTWVKVAGGLALVFVAWQVGAMVVRRRHRASGLHGADYELEPGYEEVEETEYEEADVIDV